MNDTTTTPDMADVVKTLRGAKWVMMTVARRDGKLLSHPMTPKMVTDDANAYFFLALDSGQADLIQQGGNVNLSVSKTGNWLSLSGEMELIDDRGTVNDLWSKADEQYFNGPTDPNLGLLRVKTESAQYWGLGGSKASAMVDLAKTKLPIGAAYATDKVTEFAQTVEQKYPKAAGVTGKVAQAAQQAKAKLPVEAPNADDDTPGTMGTTELPK